MKSMSAHPSSRRVSRSVRSCRPHVEVLEGRQLPGEAFLLGFWGLALAGSVLDPFGPPPEAGRADSESASHHRWIPTSDTASSPALISLVERAPTGEDRGASTSGLAKPVSGHVATDFWNRDLLLGDALTAPAAGRRPRASAGSGLDAARGGFVGLSALVETAPAGAAAFSFAGSGDHEYVPAPFFNTPLRSAGRLDPDSTAFDSLTGEVAIRGDGAGTTVREALTPGGYLDITLDGQHHSSDPAAASFDPQLAGATAARLTGIRFDGAGGRDTLVLGPQQLSGSLTVSALGATVETEDVSVGGQLTIQAADVSVRGALRGGAVALAASGWVSVEGQGDVTARRGDEGGRIAITADKFANSGQLHADGASAGQIVVRAGNVLNAGPVSADATGSGAGGAVWISSTGAYVGTVAGVTSANGNLGHGGHVVIDGGSTGRLFSSGRHEATGGVGGAVDLLGREVLLVGAQVDASGATGGGSIRIGGAFQGKNPAVNAQTTTVTGATTIRANASQAGDGGRVVVWADQETVFDGAVSARGGAAGGAGGFIEVSGKGNLNYGGAADAGARLGRAGALLLDPKNVVISAAPVGVFPQFDLIDPHPTAGGGFGSVVKMLSNGNVVVTNPNDDFSGSRAGAAYLFNGISGVLLSVLVGSHLSDQVGGLVVPLSNGNFVVGSPFWNGSRGAATWGSGSTGISGIVSEANSLVGTNPNDQIGSTFSVTPLSNGNYVVRSVRWNNNRGAITWGDGTTGVRGSISDANSLVGGPGDFVGSDGITLLSNGNYVVRSLFWNGQRGAVTWGSGTASISGIVSEANSLVGNHQYDQVGYHGIVPLSNGNYLVQSIFWNSISGAVTWGNGTTGISGIVSEANSLIGAGPNEYVGNAGVFLLTNGNYVVGSEFWNGTRGAATWGSGVTGVRGVVSEANSLVGNNPRDFLGYVVPLRNGSYVALTQGAATWGDGGIGVRGPISPVISLVGTGIFPNVIPLSNGNYVVASPSWNGNRGAATWGSGITGVSGDISDSNSLIGNSPGDQVGSRVIPLSNGNYVVASPSWNGNRGAATWGNGTAGVRGSISTANSLVGSSPIDYVGGGLVTSLSNGNFVVGSPFWNGSRGAATWGSGSTGISGIVSEANSLVGTNPNDQIGSTFSVTPLSNGNYVVRSPSWNGSRGAVTWGSGGTGVSGIVSAANSLVGSNPTDQVGFSVTILSNGNYVILSWMWNGLRGAATWGSATSGVSGIVSEANSLVGSDPYDHVGFGVVTSLSNGNYVLQSWDWNSRRGAVTWANGATGITGTVSAANSLVGGNSFDEVGVGVLTSLPNGNYLVQSRFWNNYRGAMTWGSGSTGVNGIVSEANSLVGSNPNDSVGEGGVTLLSNGNYVVRSPFWSGNRGAATWVNGSTGQTLDGRGVITAQNSLTGQASNSSIGSVIWDPVYSSFLAPFVTEGSGRIAVGLTDPNQFTYTRAQSQTVTLTPDFLTATLNTGTAVVLQASNDITVDDPIIVHANGSGGALTLQAGRSILLNAGITTDNGPLTLIANDTLANGVVDAQRDPGNAFIIMAGGTALDTGTGPLDIELRDGAGRTNTSSRAINLQTISARSVTVANNGPSAGSDVRLGPVTTTGPQNYSNPQGVTVVASDLSSGGFPITFTDSVAVNAGVSVDAGSSTVNFAGDGTQTLQTGAGVRFGNVNHNGSGTLHLAGALAVTGTLIQSAGTFDANDQPVTVGGAALVTGGTYFAGTAAQTFAGGLVIADGVFTSSTGAMTVSGGVTLTGGAFGGEGAVDALTVYRGTVAPGTVDPGVLTVAGAASFNPLTTFRALLKGIDPGSGYSQLAASGSIDLGGSALDLSLGFQPPVGGAFELLTTTDAAGIMGTFAGLPEGATFSQGGYEFQITYQGGDNGNSVVLTRIA